jgi:hypothetical protein
MLLEFLLQINWPQMYGLFMDSQLNFIGLYVYLLLRTILLWLF